MIKNTFIDGYFFNNLVIVINILLTDTTAISFLSIKNMFYFCLRLVLFLVIFFSFGSSSESGFVFCLFVVVVIVILLLWLLLLCYFIYLILRE